MSDAGHETQARLCLTPNQHARSSGCRQRPGAIDLFGYQEFTATSDRLTISAVDRSLARKARLLGSVLRPSRFAERTVLDLGANNGYFSLAALQQGARHVTAVDLDPECISNLTTARTHLGLDRLDIVCSNVADWTTPADCVFALALSHWLCACTAAFGSLNAVVAHLASLARYLLVLEFVEEHDACIKSFGHLTWQGRETTDYSREALEAALRRHFPRLRRLGDTSKTRTLYAAYKTAMDVDLSAPLPLRFPAERLLSCRYLATIEGRAVWSAVFDLGDRIVKQTTDGFALHEAKVLSLLTPDQDVGVPKVLGCERGEHWSALSIERIDGVPLTESSAEILGSRRAFTRFVRGCLSLLTALQKAGITHRDIHARNVLVRNGLPVLLDFAWAVAPQLNIEAPKGLWTLERALTEIDATPEHCDVRSMGCMLLDLSNGRYPDLETLFGTMVEPAVSLRVRDPVRLSEWLTLLESASDQILVDSHGTVPLLALAERRRQRANHLAVAATRANRTRAETETRALTLDRAVSELHARLDVALVHEESLIDLSEEECLHILTYTRQLCEHGLSRRAYAVVSCVARSLASDHPGSRLFAYLRTQLHAKDSPVDWVEVIAGAALHSTTASAGSPRARAVRYVQHCLSLARSFDRVQ